MESNENRRTKAKSTSSDTDAARRANEDDETKGEYEGGKLEERNTDDLYGDAGSKKYNI